MTAHHGASSTTVPGLATVPAPAQVSSSRPAMRSRGLTRASRACRRCRRLRTKCLDNDGGRQSCQTCRQAGADCIYPRRGEVDSDRMHRQRRTSQNTNVLSLAQSSPERTREDRVVVGEEPLPTSENSGLTIGRGSVALTPSTSGGSALVQHLAISSPRHVLGWESLPPYEEVVQGVESMTVSFFQLGFLPKALFFEKLRRDKNSVSIFLLLSILSISARFTPALVRRYEGGRNATRAFLDQAACLVQEQMFSPDIQSIQGFFLMSIAEWGNGDKCRSLVYMGIAVRLAGLRRLHREETYMLPSGATAEEIVCSEEARRTFWMLETFENLHSGSDSAVVFSYSDITVLLPCHEHEFTFGSQPLPRAALAGTRPAVKDPSLIALPSRSFFAILLQTHNLWGKVARLVSTNADADTDTDASSSGSKSRISFSEYAQLSQELVMFESSLPSQYRWSEWNLRGFRVEGFDLAYFSTVMVLGLSNIILRRSYLHEILVSPNQNNVIETTGRAEEWPVVAEELFEAMLKLNDQILAFFEYRSVDQGYPALIVFSIYVCGSLANHLRLKSSVCPRLAPQADAILQGSVERLSELQSAWPLARRWYLALCGASEKTRSHNEPVDVAPELGEPGCDYFDDILGNDIQFNDPFPTEGMFTVFETYQGNEFADNEGQEVIPSSSWNV